MTEQTEFNADRSWPTGWRAILEAMRPRHWIKNGFVAAPIVFSGRFVQWQAWIQCLAAVISFCLLASAMYLINDICDRRDDRAHPLKRNRPVASGRLSVRAAGLAGLVLVVAGMAVAAALASELLGDQHRLHGLTFLGLAAAYVVLNLLYSAWLRERVIVDVIVISLGFVIRAMAGASAIAVPSSAWLVLCTFTVCLFIALTKRRSEIVELPAEQVASARRSSAGYVPADIEHMISVAVAMSIMTYSLYCLAPETVRRFGTVHMIWTIPLVVYGLFRYNRTTRLGGKNDPVKVLFSDRAMWVVVAAYVAVAMALKLLGPKVASLQILCP